MRKDRPPINRMPIYLLMVAAAIALFAAIVFYLFFSAGKTELIKPSSPGSSLLRPAAGRGGLRVSA